MSHGKNISSFHRSLEHPHCKELRYEEETAVSELRSHTDPMENSPCVGRTIKIKEAQQPENLQFVSKKEKIASWPAYDNICLSNVVSGL